MKQSLQFKFSQQLSMTPQLQQAIKLLQLSTLELQQEIQQTLDENPLLELEQNDAEGETSVTEDDDPWEQSCSAALGQSTAVYDGEDAVYQGQTQQTLQDHLIWQMQLSHFTSTDELIALSIIDAIDDSGYLTVSLDDILSAVNQQTDETIEADEVAVVLKRIQHFDPIGVGARDVGECLLLQLQQLAPDTPWREHAVMTVREHLALLGTRDYRTLARKLRISETELSAILALIQTLQPRPGEGFSTADDDYVIPDVLVRKKNNRWTVELNPQSVPKLKVNESYLQLCQGTRQTDDMHYIRQQTQDAKWFIKSLESRNETLLKVASAIVLRQQGFFEYGEEAMKPMVLADIAAAVDMHESTISRVTTQKYMHSPRGVFELKYFFSSQLNTDNGGEASSTAIRALLKKLVAAENPKKPLSDSKLTELLAEQGIQVARRTIAKYREALNIPPSSQRKRLI
ncbi:RNA polymerase factor sigma-54 [Pseudidiomarina donghaiensis]|uniref:RNA polymerase sigma-54 factor n=1 Tax=Pseudidiomarina donghaiensis TaxID=519452 RepID=A0A432XKH7_9GAMM|nr:RNA polymerase factor sigma-54 [Pseudidiomarina donghaiensis]RUO49142.1 RNA polymerase factor sigma-54 [Pseudidiomarina donghaiensis]SFV20679.1 RNA polymerase, sigma 54 subunit, RpoN/SigL [Pseudidiomarina donghaiensis]